LIYIYHLLLYAIITETNSVRGFNPALP